MYGALFPEGVFVGVIFFEDSVHSDRYINDILQQIFNKLIEEET